MGSTSSAKTASGEDSTATTKDGKGETSEDVNEIVDAVGKIQLDDDSKQGATDKDKEEEEEEEKDVPESLKILAGWIKDGICKRILVLTGAGISVAAGIPDFRTPGTGLYSNLQKYNLPFPEAVFDLEFYRDNPRPFCTLAKEIWPGIKHAPTKTHAFLALLADKGLLLRNYSQNIDGLEHLAGIPNDLLIECHGHFRTASCTSCGAPSNAETAKSMIVHEGKAPECDRCSGYVKPDIVFFGEGLPNRFHACLRPDIRACDLVLVMGTSLQVAPVSMIPDMVSRTTKRALINRDCVGEFSKRPTKKDVFVEGNCDDSIEVLATLLGWKEELETKYQQVQTAVENKQAIGVQGDDDPKNAD